MIGFLQKMSNFLLIFSCLIFGKILPEEKTGEQKIFEQEEQSAASTVKLIEVTDHIKDLIKNMKEETEGRISTEKQRFFALPDIGDKKIKDVEKVVNLGLSQINNLILKVNSKLSGLSERPEAGFAEKINGLDLESINLVKDKVGFDGLIKESSRLEKAVFDKIKKIETETPPTQESEKPKTKS